MNPSNTYGMRTDPVIGFNGFGSYTPVGTLVNMAVNGRGQISPDLSFPQAQYSDVSTPAINTAATITLTGTNTAPIKVYSVIASIASTSAGGTTTPVTFSCTYTSTTLITIYNFKVAIGASDCYVFQLNHHFTVIPTTTFTVSAGGANVYSSLTVGYYLEPYF